ncbi:hypothetical protein ACFCV3_36510 [Kribbella sp. NPDC056345]|uniref:hypothetical protein n=1 Tax=Kribbella sp. NPDC056345 TaxID=3345789 RepID=UPI0035D70073
MRRLLALLGVLTLAGCGIQPSGVSDGGEAPTGLAAGPTLYFVDASQHLVAQPRMGGRLGTIADALALLMTGPGDSGNLHTEIASGGTTRFGVAINPDVIELTVPLTADDVTSLGMDQIVCTAVAVHIQSGGSRSMKVRLVFTLTTPESDRLRTCPLIS